MAKNLLYTALGLMGLMGILAIGVVSAAETRVIPGTQDISYTLNGDEEHPFTAKTLTITDCDAENPTEGCTTITILDRNLGATAVGTGCDDSIQGTECINGTEDATYGYHFQWGNNHGFKPNFNNDASFPGNEVVKNYDVANIDASGYGPGNYYSGSTFITDSSISNNGDWSVSRNDNLRGGSLTESTDGFNENGDKIDDIRSAEYLGSEGWKVTNATNRRGPCPEGFHVPSVGELAKLTNMFGLDDRWGIKVSKGMHTGLNIPFAGYRYVDNAYMNNMGNYAYLWSSSPSSAESPYSRYFNLYVAGYLSMDSSYRAYAYSVRCFYDSYQPFTQFFSLTFATSEDNGNTSAETGSVASGTVIVLSTGDFEATKDGWTHLGWNTNASATGVLESITMTEDTTVYAIFSKDLTVNYATGAGVSTIQKKSDSCSMYNTGTSCALTVPDITEDEGYENGVWKKGNDTVNPGENITLTSDGDTYTYTATASAKEFAIRFVDSNQQNVDVIYSGAYKSGTSNITYPSWTRDGYTISWDKPIPPTMPLNGDIITANWTENKKPSGGSSGGRGRSKTDTDMQKEDKASTDSSAETQNDNQNTQDSQQNEKASANVSEGQNYSEEFQEAYKFAKEKGITTMTTINDANMKGKLTRIAMAKMLSYYAINVLGQKPDENRNNKFNDITDKLDAQYDSGVILAYQLGIMGINMPDNKFRPNDEVTRAEFATALSRMLYSIPDGKPYYTTHLEKLKSEGILKNDDYKMKELRGYVMIMLMRSTNSN